ncbi:MAG: hypothetical protein AAFR31_08880 [Cyanobacteria bacterium J06627_8]
MTMTESSIDDITQQARQGSVAAIIQVLNDRLSECGVRTRAVLAQGMLQLLCEAETTERLERDTLVRQIRQILSGLRPRHIRRVKINSRLVKEQQLLWLDEIQKDPDNQLLWTEEISLPRPNPIQLIVEDLTANQKREKITATPTKSRKLRDRRQFARGIIGGAALSLLVIIVGWTVYARVRRTPVAEAENTSPSASVSDTVTATVREAEESSLRASDANERSASSSEALSSTSASEADATFSFNEEEAGDDPFAQAVLIAQAAVNDGQAASTTAEWLDLASRWQRASDLMGAIPESDERYETAQNRQALYRANSEEALLQANLHQAQPEVE